MRSVTSPFTRNGTPGLTLGRCAAIAVAPPPPNPNRYGVPLTFWLTPTGNPLLNVTTVVTDQPPARKLARPLWAHLRPAPNGRFSVGATTILCGESSRLRPYSASGS